MARSPWRRSPNCSWSSVHSYDFKQTGKTLTEDVRKQAKEKLYFGVLYDPASNLALDDLIKSKVRTREDREKWWKESYPELRRRSESESKRLLRLQVQDFLKWLEAQGAI